MAGTLGRSVAGRWRALVALLAMSMTMLVVPMAAPAGAAPIDCEEDDLQAALTTSSAGDTIQLVEGTVCFGGFAMPNHAITLEGLGSGATLDGSEEEDQRVLQANNVGASTIRNLTIRNGEYHGNGAGIKVQGDSAVTIERVRFENNNSDDEGGGLAVKPTGTGTTTIRDSVFGDREDNSGNRAVNGGGLAVRSDGPIVLENNRFEDNFAFNSGGGLYVESPDVTMIDNVFDGNDADSLQAQGSGGGAYLELLSGASASLDGDDFIQNLTPTEGGGLFVSMAADATASLANATFSENRVLVDGCQEGDSYGGGGLAINGSRTFSEETGDVISMVTQVNNTFFDNVVSLRPCFDQVENLALAAESYYGELYGGGEWVRDAHVTSLDDTFNQNEVANIVEFDGVLLGAGDAEGGGLSIERESGNILPFDATNLVLVNNEARGIGLGGGAYVGGQVNAHLVHATVTNNDADLTGGGLAGDGTDDLTIDNSIVWGNTAGTEGNEAVPEPDIDGFDEVVVRFSDVCETEGQPFEEGSTGNICEDPMLADVADGEAHQTSTSPTLDRASNALSADVVNDYEGEPRRQDALGNGPTPDVADMGADEFTEPAPVPVVEEEKKPDVQAANLTAPGSIGEDDGYCLAARDGGVFTFGGCQFFGAASGSGRNPNVGRIRLAAEDITAPQSLVKLNAPVISIAMQPSDTGYWQAAEDGGVFSFGTAQFHGSMGSTPLTKPIIGIASSPTGNGYWLVASDGGVFSFGDAPFLGSTGAITLNKPIVGITATPSGKGYWLVASDGGVFSFGDAQFFGSTGGTTLNAPIVGMGARPGGLGYWLAAADGGVFSFGDAPFFGNRVGQPLNAPVIGIKSAASGNGYWLVAKDGGIFSYGSAPFLGSTGSMKLNQPVIDMTG